MSLLNNKQHYRPRGSCNLTGQFHTPKVFYGVRGIKKPRLRLDLGLIADPNGFCLHFERKVDDHDR
jgi:hypothetical protein